MNQVTSLLFRIAIVAICLFASQHTLRAQQADTNHRLLWQISGNGLPAPSYLYGTMHIRDQRAFDFSDSVLIKLRECAAFAMEIQPDSAITYVYRSIFSRDSTDSGDVFRKYMTDEQYRKFNEKLEAELGFEPTSVNKSRPWAIRQYIDKSDENFKEDRSTFVDAYLYRFARQFNKEIFPLEKVEDQLNSVFGKSLQEQVQDIAAMLDDSVMTQGTELADSMLTLYNKGRVAALYDLINSYDDAEGALELATRNHGMVARLLPTMRQKSVFVAVGAAHLPGAEGLIELLKKHGYTVSPVAATFTGVAKEIVAQPLNDPWYKLVSEEAGFAIDMPIEPVEVPLADKNISYKMQLTTDLSSGASYIAAYAVMPVYVPDALLHAVLDSAAAAIIEKGALVGDIEYITLQNRQGIAFSVEKENSGSFNARMFAHGNMLYMFMTTISKEEVDAHDIDRFFSSISFRDIPRDTTLSSGSITNTTGAFAINFPSKPQFATQESEFDDEGNMVQTHLYSASDADGLAYFAGYYSYPGGFEAPYRPGKISEIFDKMAARINGEIAWSVDTTWHGYSSADGLITAPTTSMRVRLLLRDNRPYIFMILGNQDALGEQKVEGFLNSFRLVDYSPANWHSYTSDEHNFTVNFPGELRITRDTADISEIAYAAVDSNSSTNYILEVNEFSEYRESENEDSFFEMVNGWYKRYLDTVYSSRRFTVSGYPAMELVKGVPESETAQKIWGVLCGRRLYILSVIARRERLAGTDVNKFFSSLVVPPGAAKATMFEDRTPLLLRDLISPDSATAERASWSVSAHKFTNKDLPGLYPVLEKEYSSDDEYSGVRMSIIADLGDIADSTTLTFLQKLFPSLSAKPELQRSVLSALASINTEQSLAAFTELINTPALGEETTVPFYNIATTTSSYRVMFPKVLSMIDRPSVRTGLYYFLSKALDSGAITAKDIAVVGNKLVDTCASEYDVLLAHRNDDDYYNYYNVENALPLISYIGSDKAKALLQRIGADTSASLAMEASLALARNNYNPGAERWEFIAADPLLRNSLYERLEKTGHSAWFPQEFYSQESFAEADFIRLLVDDYEEAMPEKLKLVKEFERAEGEKAGRYFLFKYLSPYDEQGEDGETWLVGISGPQPIDKKKVSTSGIGTAPVYKKFDDLSGDESLEAFLNDN